MFDDQKMNQIKVTTFTIYIPGYKLFSYVTKTENMKPTNILHKCPRIDTIALRTPECAPDGWDTGTVTFGHYNKYTKLIRHCAHKVIHSTIDIAVRLYCNHEISRYH